MRKQRGAVNVEYIILIVVGALAVVLGLGYLATVMNDKHTQVASGVSEVEVNLSAEESDYVYVVGVEDGLPWDFFRVWKYDDTGTEVASIQNVADLGTSASLYINSIKEYDNHLWTTTDDSTLHKLNSSLASVQSYPLPPQVAWGYMWEFSIDNNICASAQGNVLIFDYTTGAVIQNYTAATLLPTATGGCNAIEFDANGNAFAFIPTAANQLTVVKINAGSGDYSTYNTVGTIATVQNTSAYGGTALYDDKIYLLLEGDTNHSNATDTSIEWINTTTSETGTIALASVDTPLANDTLAQVTGPLDMTEDGRFVVTYSNWDNSVNTYSGVYCFNLDGSSDSTLWEYTGTNVCRFSGVYSGSITP